MIQRKKEVAETVLGTDEACLAELSTAELKDPVTLRNEAVAR